VPDGFVPDLATRDRECLISTKRFSIKNDILGAKRRCERVLLAWLLTGFGGDIRGMGNAREIDKEGWQMGIQWSQHNP
jgi:hypothetical protein